jgi:hypothetical protein
MLRLSVEVRQAIRAVADDGKSPKNTAVDARAAFRRSPLRRAAVGVGLTRSSPLRFVAPPPAPLFPRPPTRRPFAVRTETAKIRRRPDANDSPSLNMASRHDGAKGQE